MKLQQMMSLLRKAIDEFQMIEEGDRIAVGISGGKDSLTLLAALSGIARFYPKKFSLAAVSVNLGFPEADYSAVKAYCEGLGVEYHQVDTQIGEIIFDVRKESNPCSLCSKMRKGALNEAVKEMGFNKVAYGHHKDDAVETMLLSLIYEGRFSSFAPVTYLDRMDLTVIRPMLYVNEADVIGFKNLYNLLVFKNPCPADGNTKREYAHNLLKSINEEAPGVKERMFSAILNGDLKGWKDRVPHTR